MNTAVLVVLYNKDISESKTLISLISIEYSDYDLFIVNNGPSEIISYETDDVFLNLSAKLNNVTLLQKVDNSPLSILYNDFLNKNKNSDAYVIFDDDSIVPYNYFCNIKESFLNSDVDILTPRIKSNLDGEGYYPILNGNVIFNDGVICLNSKSDMYSIGSGLVIFNKLLVRFNKFGDDKYFDERFALYGVDISIFRKIKKLVSYGEEVRINVVGELEHELSRLSKEQEPWRKKERLIDYILSIMYYQKNCFRKFFYITKALAKSIIYFKFQDASVILYLLLKGKHPRC